VTALLLDTHVVLWWILASPRLRGSWVEAITDSGNTVGLSAASVWEVEIKKRRGKLEFDHDLLSVASDYGFVTVSISAEDARRAGSLEWDHRDPFDRMLVAQSIERRMILVTDDAAVIAAPGVVAL